MALFWDLYQLRRIRQTEATAGEARQGLQEQRFATRDLELQVERLTTVVLALAEILRDRDGIPLEVIEAKIQEVEHRGVIPHPKPKRCGACGQVSGPAHTSCMYCGKPLASEPFFSTSGTRTEHEGARDGKDDQESINSTARLQRTHLRCCFL
jgi:hypothetical protein